jgi:hypothetical protein
MTNEERVEEILIKSHNLGIRKEVINSAVALMDVDKTISFYDAIDKAYRIEKNKLKDK